MLYLKKVTTYSAPKPLNGVSVESISGVFLTKQETIEPIAGAYSLYVFNGGSVAAQLIDNPRAIQDTPRTRFINRDEEAYIVNESGATITVINGPNDFNKHIHRSPSVTVSGDGNVFINTETSSLSIKSNGEVSSVTKR